MPGVPFFRADDGTELAYHVQGAGSPLICLPGGPMLAAAYLGDLGGMAGSRQVIRLDLRGTGQSAVPADPATYRCDRLIDDVRALQDHLGLDRVAVLGHSAGGNIAVQYAARQPQRVARLALITPSTRAVGLTASAGQRAAILNRRRAEPWYPAAAAAFERIQAGAGTEDNWAALAPPMHGRWDAAAQELEAAFDSQVNRAAAEVFSGAGAFDPAGDRARLAGFGAPVLLLAGELDINTPPPVTADYAALFPRAKLIIQPMAGHYPWLDDAGWFSSVVAAFLDDPG